MRFMKCSRIRAVRSATAFLSCFLLPTMTLSGSSPAPVCRDHPYAEMVFVGTLMDFALSPTLSPMRFEAIEPLTGETFNRITIMREPGSACRNPEPPVVGEQYLVFASTLNGNMLGTYGCAGLKRKADAKADIEYFRLAASGLTPTEVSGEVRVTGGRPIKGAKVHLAGTDERRELTSDAKGRFHAKLQPGTYSVTAEFPKGYEAEDCGWSTLILKEHRCVQTVICAQPETGTPVAVE